jgi:hypothetical protein
MPRRTTLSGFPESLGVLIVDTFTWRRISADEHIHLRHWRRYVCRPSGIASFGCARKTGRGQQVEASMFDTQVAWIFYSAAGYFATGSAPAKKMGSAAPHVVPYQA